MDPNLMVLLILLGVGTFVGLLVAVVSSEHVRQHGLVGTVRRTFSGGSHRNRYSI